MQVTVEVPEAIADALVSSGIDLPRTTLEALGLELYRNGSLTGGQLRQLLGFETRYQLDGFLKEHNVEEGAYGLADLEQDIATMAKLGFLPPGPQA